MTTTTERPVTQLSGVWFNQLGSRLEMACDDDGRLTGTFESSVSGARGRHALSGYADPHPADETGAIGFTVSWSPGHAVTVWSGHYHGGRQEIAATWLLTTGGPFGPEAWRSTVIGHDVFRRQQPDDGAEALPHRSDSPVHRG